MIHGWDSPYIKSQLGTPPTDNHFTVYICYIVNNNALEKYLRYFRIIALENFKENAT